LRNTHVELKIHVRYLICINNLVKDGEFFSFELLNVYDFNILSSREDADESNNCNAIKI
jgi:hypothetical protein